MKPTTRRLACSFWLGRRPSPSFRPAGLSGRFAAHRSGRAGAQARRLGQLRSVGVFGCVLCLLCFVLCVCNGCAFVCVLAFVFLLCFGCFFGVFFVCPSFGPVVWARPQPAGRRRVGFNWAGPRPVYVWPQATRPVAGLGLLVVGRSPALN